MNETVFISESNVQSNGRIDHDIKNMTEKLYLDMNGTVSRTAVEQTLIDLFASYEEAPVQLFVPIIVRRQAKDLLRKLAA